MLQGFLVFMLVTLKQSDAGAANGDTGQTWHSEPEEIVRGFHDHGSCVKSRQTASERKGSDGDKDGFHVLTFHEVLSNTN
jgi:hypothetical protein